MGSIPQEPRLGRPLTARPAREATGEDLRLEIREGVGDVLRRAREGFREDLNLVAQTLKIRYAYLKAIEDRSYKDLPGPAYAVGFVRTYAEYLGLDASDLVRRFKEEVEGIDKRQALHFPTPAPESRVPGGAVLLISFLLAGLAYGGWSYLVEEDHQVADLVPPVPEGLQALIGETPAGKGTIPGTSPGTSSSEPAARLSEGGAAPADSWEAGAGSSVAGPLRGLADAGATGAGEARSEAGTEASRVGLSERDSILERPDPVSASPIDAVAAVPQEPPMRLDVTPPPEEDSAAEASEAPGGSARADASSGVQRITLDRVLAGGQPGPNPASPPAASPPAASPSAAIAGEPRLTLDTTPVDDGETMTIPDAPEATQIAALANEPAPQVYGADNESARVVLRARQDSWVQIRDGADELLLTRVLRRGDEYRVPNRDGLILRTGNAGGIEILVDGAPMSAIGPVGSVRGEVSLDPEQLLGGGQNR